MVNIGDRYRVQPAFFGSDNKDTRKMVGTVVMVYPRFALLDFGNVRECFHIYGDSGLLNARRA